MLLRNPDDSARPTNSGKTVYQIEGRALELIRTFDTRGWIVDLAAYMASGDRIGKKLDRGGPGPFDSFQRRTVSRPLPGRVALKLNGPVGCWESERLRRRRPAWAALAGVLDLDRDLNLDRSVGGKSGRIRGVADDRWKGIESKSRIKIK